jgi:acetyl-CoA carboxylase biotin carboxylase subunit
MPPLFRKILIANRGEIAVRIIRTCRELGIASVAVFSEADQTALYTRLADEAIYIGPPTPRDSYLSIEKLLDAARKTGAQAIHPGYGFLSENADFAQAVNQNGLIFIGPSAEAIREMGDKSRARLIMHAAGVPVVPGYQGPEDLAGFQSTAQKIGYPVLVKAAAGGGGKGMRVVNHPAELESAMSAARREALHAFGDQRLILEAYIPNARHIEFQILADHYGNLLHLFERECSIQRRHQKVIEESPSPYLSPSLRAKMGQAAIAAAEAVHYQNAGTVEFIVDPSRDLFYFLEMNTRLQVEHPVTELITGLNLVAWQIRIAAGERLPFDQGQLSQRGHAIEARLYAEDPENDFLPTVGQLINFIEPSLPGVRIDSGFTSGDWISIHYDPLIAKVIAFAETRTEAAYKLQTALRETVLLGLPTNWRFLLEILSSDDFLDGRLYTTWVEDRFADWRAPHCDVPVEVLVAAALTQFQSLNSAGTYSTDGEPYNPWRVANQYRFGEQR